MIRRPWRHNDIGVRGILAEAHLIAGDLDTAREHALEASEKRHEYPSVAPLALGSLARIRFLEGDYDGALELCCELESSPMFPSAR